MYHHWTPVAAANVRCSDIWAIGVITYFLLCGYTPFDRESNLEEMQAILAADYSFTPLEYWRGVSQTARDFIKRCLTIDPTKRMTAHQALAHPWISPDADTPVGTNADLLPTVKKNFNARRTLHAAIDTIRAINKLREGGMGGQLATNGGPHKPINPDSAAAPVQQRPGEQRRGESADVHMGVEGEPGEQFVAQGEAAMEIDGRGHGRGQTKEMIAAQEQKIKETTAGLWSRPGK